MNRLTLVKEIDRVNVYISNVIGYLKERQKTDPVVLILDEENLKNDTSFVRYAIMLESENDEIDTEYLRLVVARFLGRPYIIGSDNHLCVRELQISDADDIRELYDCSRPVFLEALFSENENGQLLIKKYIEDVYDFYGYGIWAVQYENELIGLAGLIQRDSGLENPDLELGYFISFNYQRKGLGYRACKIIMDYAKENIVYNQLGNVLLVTDIDAANKISKKISFITLFIL